MVKEPKPAIQVKLLDSPIEDSVFDVPNILSCDRCRGGVAIRKTKKGVSVVPTIPLFKIVGVCGDFRLCRDCLQDLRSAIDKFRLLIETGIDTGESNEGSVI